VSASVGYSLEWVASEVGVPPRRIEEWISKGLLPRPGRGKRDGYSHEFVLQALVVHEWLQLYPRGPVENLRDILYPEPEEDEE
jgi:hypothetical protein